MTDSHFKHILNSKEEGWEVKEKEKKLKAKIEQLFYHMFIFLFLLTLYICSVTLWASSLFFIISSFFFVLVLCVCVCVSKSNLKLQRENIFIVYYSIISSGQKINIVPGYKQSPTHTDRDCDVVTFTSSSWLLSAHVTIETKGQFSFQRTHTHFVS